MNIWTTLLIVVAIAVLWLIYAYNKLVRFKNRVEEAWSDIDVQLKRRYDLIPNLVEVVRGYTSHEKEVFKDVTEARSKALSAEHSGNVNEVKRAESGLSGALKTLFAVAEDYPDLKANANFLDLQRELADTENKIQSARRFYNTNVKDLNTVMESFPYNIISSRLGFQKRNFFDLDNDAEREVVDVEF